MKHFDLWEGTGKTLKRVATGVVFDAHATAIYWFDRGDGVAAALLAGYQSDVVAALRRHARTQIVWLNGEPVDDAAEPVEFDTGYRTIIVNGRAAWAPDRLTYSEVVELAMGPGKKDRLYAVTYHGALSPEKNGTMVSGDVVAIRSGTLFTVTGTRDA
jgi:hypothetical protein